YRNFCRNAEFIFMRSRQTQTPPVHQLEVFPLCIKEPALKKAISLSVALKRPIRNFGAVADSSLGGHPKTGHVWPPQNRPYETTSGTRFSTPSVFGKQEQFLILD